jgi:lactoylglutathione lyase
MELIQMLKLISALIFISFLSFNASAKNTSLTEGLNHLGLTVSDLNSSASFFIDTLGWEEKGGDSDYPAKFVSDGNIFLTLWQTTSEKNTVKFDRKNNVGLHHLALTVVSFDALDELHERFKKVEGVVIEFAPELAFGGPGKHMMIREPSGNRLEFIFRPN